MFAPRLLVSSDLVGVVTGDRVLLRLKPGIEAVSAILACSMHGAVFVPVDPDLPEDRPQAIAKTVQPALEITARDAVVAGNCRITPPSIREFCASRLPTALKFPGLWGLVSGFLGAGNGLAAYWHRRSDGIRWSLK